MFALVIALEVVADIRRMVMMKTGDEDGDERLRERVYCFFNTRRAIENHHISITTKQNKTNKGRVSVGYMNNNGYCVPYPFFLFSHYK